MARSADNLIYYAVVGGGLYLGYTLALDGQLGDDIQKAAFDIYRAVTGKDYRTGVLPPGKTPTPGEVSQAVWGDKYREWLWFAESYGLNLNDWGAFRNYASSKGWGDPGQNRPSWAN